MKILMVVLMVILLALQVNLWSGEGSFAEMNRLDDRIAAQALENNGLEQRNESLIQEVDDLKTGLDSIEERARNELGLIKKGETFFWIVEDEAED